MYGLDLFSGIGGITKALKGYVEPVAYCENDRYAQATLLSRMAKGDIPLAPIWDDVTTLRGTMLPPVEIVYGGFPCQDISNAGRREGLEGKRSGLFFEIIRLISEIRPRFVFLENVSAIPYRGLGTITTEFAKLRYDCRWGILSAKDVGANHLRERWWLLAHTSSIRRRGRNRPNEKREETAHRSKKMADSEGLRMEGEQLPGRLKRVLQSNSYGSSQKLSDTSSIHAQGFKNRQGQRESRRSGWWSVEPPVGRVADGVSMRVERLTGLGNAVVPEQAREAFERLMGLTSAR